MTVMGPVTLQGDIPLRESTVNSNGGESARAIRAAKDFETLLIGNLLRSMQQSFLALGGEQEKPAGFDDYHYMATQAIASALESGGGLGLSKLILKQLGRYQ